ncbi:hypothetical protein [Thermotalea metallivorans]|uniref:hypothetical protein n=1 Tax=Thermotalea metallivorans TaxID=520762 RepID=UPI0012EE16B9|nr:hypothetical protein [Thermotalea metallivorans]
MFTIVSNAFSFFYDMYGKSAWFGDEAWSYTAILEDEIVDKVRVDQYIYDRNYEYLSSLSRSALDSSYVDVKVMSPSGYIIVAEHFAYDWTGNDNTSSTAWKTWK